MKVALRPIILASLRFDDGSINDNATNQLFDWLNEEKYSSCTVLTITRARSSKSFILCLYMKTIRAKQAKVHSAYLVQRDQHGIIAKDFI